MASVTVRDLFEQTRESLRLELLAGRRGLDRTISVPRIQKPGLALAGFLRQLHPERVQVLGQTEMEYLATLPPGVAEARVEGLCSSGVSCLVVAKGQEVTEPMVRLSERHGICLFRSPEVSSLLIRRITTFLEGALALETTLHGGLVDVYGVGILLLGKSGIGKSECALGLVERGHRLVADDVVVVRRRVPGELVGVSADLLRNHMEIRGLGIINVRDMFGVSSVREHKKVELLLELVEWTPDLEVERLGLEERTVSILDVAVPHLVIPVRPARDLTMIVEVAARNHLLKRMGYDAARTLTERQAPYGQPDAGTVE